MLNILAVGVLIADPQRRTGQTGRDFVGATMRASSEGSEGMLVSLVGFSDIVIDALMALTKGDALAVVGRSRLTSWTSRDGGEQHGLSCVVDQLLTHYEVAKRRKRAQAAADPVEA